MQTKVLLSIKPEFADKIFAGTKKFEFRRTIFRSANVKTVVVYSSSPVQKIIGEFDVRRVLALDLEELWERTSKHAGIDKEYFDQYFDDKGTGYAIEIARAKRYPEPKNLTSVYASAKPPQSFCYVS